MMVNQNYGTQESLIRSFLLLESIHQSVRGEEMSDPAIDSIVTQRVLEKQAASIREFLTHASPGVIRRVAEQDVKCIERVIYILQNKMPYEL